MTNKVSTRYHHGNLREALIETALELLETKGLEGVTLRAVGARIGVSRAAPYAHFRDKNTMLAAVAAHGFRLLQTRLKSTAASPTHPAAHLAALGVCYIQFAQAHPALYRLMFSDEVSTATGQEELRNAAEAAYGELAGAVQQVTANATADELDTYVAQTAAWSLVHGLALLLIDGKLAGSSESDLTRRVTRLFAERLLGAPPERGDA